MDLTPHRHTTLGFSRPVPDWWEAGENLLGTALIAVEPPRPPSFRANVNVTVEEPPPGTTLEDWVRRGQDQLGETTLIDREETEIGGRAAIRSLNRYVDPAHGEIALEQWTVLAGATAYVISASVAASAGPVGTGVGAAGGSWGGEVAGAKVAGLFGASDGTGKVSD